MAAESGSLKPIPKFESEDEEREFWASHDSTDYFDYRDAREVVFPKLRPSTATISLRLPQGLLDDLRVLANQRDVPYQSLLKVYLAERVSEERQFQLRRRRRASAKLE
jgi:predicted DNA binding CopG/RHH family protein